MHFTKLTKKLVALTLLLLLMLPLTTKAAPPASKWEAWLYDSSTGTITRVNSQGTPLGNQTLPALGQYAYSDDIAFSHDGRYAAYTLTDSNTPTNQQLMIYDTNAQQPIVTYPIPSTTPQDVVMTSLDIGSAGSKHMYNPADTQFAFGYQVTSTWEILIFDLAGGSVINRLPHTHPAFSGGAKQAGSLPIPRYYDGAQLYFTYIPTQTGGLPINPAYLWTLSSNTVQDSGIYATMSADTFGPAGEVISTRYNQNLPNNNGQMTGILNQQNTLHVGTIGNLATFPAYNDPNYTLFSPRFMENGQYVVMRAEEVKGHTINWRVIDRSGNVRGFLGIGKVHPTAMMGVADGILYTADANAMKPYLNVPLQNYQTSVLMYADTRGKALVPGSVMWLGSANSYAVLSWVGDNLRNQRAIPSGGWTNLNPNINVGDLPPLKEDLPDVPVDELPADELPEF